MIPPAVSTVIPAFNAATFVGETITSVLALEYPPDLMELIVVDDGSTDTTSVEVRRLLRSCPFRWEVIEQPNGGPSRARNVGWRAAHGEWIQFLDADDILDATKLRVQIKVAANSTPDVAVVYSPWQRFSRQDGGWRPIGALCVPHVGRDSVFDLLETKNFLPTGSHLMRRSMLEQVGGFNEAYRLIEDVDLLLRFAIVGGSFAFAHADQPLLRYRQREGSLSRESRHRFVDGCVRNAFLAERFWKQRGASLTEQQRDLLLAIYGEALRLYFQEDRQHFRLLLAHVLELDPEYRRGGRALRFLTRIVGHEAAESIAVRYRRIRYRAGSISK